MGTAKSSQAQIEAYGKTVRQQRDTDLKNWQKILQNRKNQLNISEEKESKIIRSYAHELVQMLNKGETTSIEILTVLAYRCCKVATTYNLITEEDFKVAEKAAIFADDYRKQTKKQNWTLQDTADYSNDPEQFLPPLFGIPLSVKDLFDMKGKRTTIGSTVRAHQIKEKDCGIIACFRQAGLIPFVRSNVAQLTMTYETHNYLYGRSLNVWNTKRNIGGSSGGEGGLLASFCSPIGIGSDIGGSLRIPAEFNGITSLRPCFQRFSTSREYCTNYPEIIYGKDTVVSVMGPMARCVDDLALWMKTACEERFHVQPDPFHKHVSFNVETFKEHSGQKLRIGIIKSYAQRQATPASQRAVEEVASILKKQGHQVIPVEIPNLDSIVEEFYFWWSAEGNFQSLDEFLNGEKPGPSFDKMRKAATSNKFTKCITNCYSQIFPLKWLPNTLKNNRTLTITEYTQHKSRVSKLRMSFCDWWKIQGLDHIITPGFGCQPNLIELSESLWPCLFYTLIWNCLNMPAGILPVTLVKEDQQYYEPKESSDKELIKAMKQNAEGSVGLPVGVMVVGLPFEEEKVLSVMRNLQNNVMFEKYRKVPS